MTSESKYFDMIRIKRSGKGKVAEQASLPSCQWKGCDKPGHHKAPKGRGQDGEFFVFCATHVRQYNASYNYFDGMSDKDVADFQRSAAYGHRPTWKLGQNASGTETRKESSGEGPSKDFHAWRAKQATARKSRPQRRLKPMEKKSFAALELTETASKDDIKAQYKALVKRHHPDANGGDRGSEDKLREIIQAYNYLKQVGLV
jgi:curved DNA-binding protein CbpA